MLVTEKLKLLKDSVEELESKYCENCQEWDCDYCRFELEGTERREE